jgi:erythritol transport system ATP-binding protein
VKTPSLEAPITALSGGNQQKVVLARGVMSRPKVLLVDEPTRGVDVGAKAEILDALRRLASEGLGIVFATADLGEIQAAATRVVVMSRGRVTADLPLSEATPDLLASAASSTAAEIGAEHGRP